MFVYIYMFISFCWLIYLFWAEKENKELFKNIPEWSLVLTCLFWPMIIIVWFYLLGKEKGKE